MGAAAVRCAIAFLVHLCKLLKRGWPQARGRSPYASSVRSRICDLPLFPHLITCEQASCSNAAKNYSSEGVFFRWTLMG